MITLFLNILSKYEFSSLHFIALSAAFFLIMLNEYLRFKYLCEDEGMYAYLSSLAIAFICSSWIMFTHDDSFYFYAILFEIGFSDLPGKVANSIITSHAIVYISGLIYSVDNIDTLFSREFWMGDGSKTLFNMSVYSISLLVSLFIKIQGKERMKFRELNDELKDANDKLKDYSDRVEELAISKERGRVASEIHDSLGHSLTAIIMHLDFLEKVADKDIEKTKEIISKCQNLARDSMKGLRKAVYTLNEENKGRGLKDSINELIDNLCSSGEVAISLDIDESIENTPPNMKNIIYRTVMEGLTNSIKHVKSKKISIDIYRIRDGIGFKIKDYGSGCSKVIKGNGLKSIEERVSKVNGEVIFTSKLNEGFLIDAYIPLKGAKAEL